MYGVPLRGQLQGQTRDNSNTRFFHNKKEHIYMCSYIISVVHIVHMSYHILFKEIYFDLLCSSHIWSAYVAGNLIKIKKTGKMKYAYNKDKTLSIILKR